VSLTSEQAFLHLEQILLAKDVTTQLVRECPDHTKEMFTRFFEDQIERAQARILAVQGEERLNQKK